MTRLRGIDGTDTALCEARAVCRAHSAGRERDCAREIFLELTGICTHLFSSAECKRLFSSCARIRSETPPRREPVVTYAANTRSSSPAIERGERLAGERTLTGPTVFKRTSAPALLRFSFASRRKEGGTLQGLRALKSTQRTQMYLCRSLAREAAVRAYTRARGQADRRANKTFWCKDHVGKEKASCERNENDYPERWITWLVGR